VKNLAMHIMDILQNSIRAGATMISLVIEEDTKENMLNMVITDNGKGMNPAELSRATDPFFTTRTTRKVGLGLSLLRQNALRTRGAFSLESTPGKGTIVTSRFRPDHPDMLPFGDLAGAFLLPVVSNPSVSFTYFHRKNDQQYRFSTEEVRAALGGISLESPELYGPLHGMISENLRDISVS
jgi:anti-sigma regulatory factor (Ser/Thr protein kinase)